MFDFGVPLEDVFPPDDIHPRLKYLFKQAYHYYVTCELELDLLLRKYQGSLQQRLDLKDKLVYEERYRDLPRYPCGSYFWLLRHFLGLLPIPLLPVCSNNVTFDWEGLSGRCRNFLKQYQLRRQNDSELIFIITENLNSLSPQHFLLVKVLIVFIRKVSQVSPTNTLLSKKKLLTLARYFCGAIFNRPYRPGYETDNLKMLPLALYILIRWKKIQTLSSRLGHPLDSDVLISQGSEFNSFPNAKPLQFNPDVIPIYRNIPVIQKVYLRDESSQTEVELIDVGIATDSEEKSAPLASSTFILETSESSSGKLDLENFVTAIDSSEMRKESGNVELSGEISKMRLESDSRPCSNQFITAIDQTEMLQVRNESSSKPNLNTTHNGIEDKVVEMEIEDPHAVDSAEQCVTTRLKGYLSFTTKPSRELEKALTPPEAIPFEPRECVMKRPLTTKSDSGFRRTVYDDYGAISSNQVTTNNKKPSLLRKLSMKSLNYFSKQTDDSPEDNDDSYIKYDVIDSDYEDVNKSKSIDITLNSRKILCHDAEGKSKANFDLKRFKINMDFLRILRVPMEVKYMKIKNVKANTI